MQAGDSEDQEFEKAYKNFVKSMSTVCLENDKTSDECVNIKVESVSEDEDCQIVSVTTLGNEREAADVIHEILDDDEDDIEIIYLKKNSDKQVKCVNNYIYFVIAVYEFNSTQIFQLCF